MCAFFTFFLRLLSIIRFLYELLHSQILYRIGGMLYIVSGALVAFPIFCIELTETDDPRYIQDNDMII